VAAVPQAPVDTGVQASASDIAGQVCTTEESPRTLEETLPSPLPQAFNPICRADCREDYGACLISTPQYICNAIYQNCLANC